MLLVRAYVGLSYPEIGRLFGGRDHSTVIHGCNQAELWLASRPGIRDHLIGLVKATEAREAA
jgi:chromosomal replication initiator protein